MKNSKHNPPVGHRTKGILEQQRRFKKLTDTDRPGTWHTIKYRMGDNPLPQNLSIQADSYQQARSFAVLNMPMAQILS